MELSSREIAKRIIKATYSEDTGVFFKGGKETMVMLSIMHELYGDVLKNPFLFLDSGKEQKELYDFIHERAEKDQMQLHTFKFTDKEDKVRALAEAVSSLKLEKVYVAIRRDENPARANEQYLRLREDHIRIHPMLEFTEEEIWQELKDKNIPYCKLYDEGYRSLGDGAQKTNGPDERAGRDQEKEKVMERLRNLGYF